MAPQPLSAISARPLLWGASLNFIGIRSGNLEVTLARTPEEIVASQKLRYRIFCDEMGATPTEEARRTGCDSDEFDAYCEHLVVVDHARTNGKADNADGIVGTYRLLTRNNMQRVGRFYSESEFDISCLKQYPGEVMELGRSCVDENYRSRAVMQLLWRGIAQYIDMHGVQILFGCASFHGCDPSLHIGTLSYLHHYHLAPQEIRPRPVASRAVAIDYLPKEKVDAKAEFAALPALIKGYLRLGGVIGEGLVIDHEYNTIDVSLMVKTDIITEKYVQRFAPSESK